MSNTYLGNLRQVDEVLTKLALGYRQGGFIGERIMPVVLTEKEGIKVPNSAKARLWSTPPNARWAQPAM